MPDDSKSAMKLASEMKGLDTSGVEVDEEQVVPTIEVGSAEETAALAEMEKLIAAGVEADQFTKLMCLRGRKYDAARAAALLPELLALKSEFGIDAAAGDQLKADLRSHKVCATGAKDADGRAIVWLRFRFHDPKTSKAEDMARLITTVMLHVLKDPEVQRRGIVVIQDMSGVKLKNLDPSAGKKIFGEVFPRLPVRVGRICLFHPPWIIGNIILPIVFTFMSKKLRGRIAVINGPHPEKLLEFLPKESVPDELEGGLAFDAPAWSEAMVAALPK